MIQPRGNEKELEIREFIQKSAVSKWQERT